MSALVRLCLFSVFLTAFALAASEDAAGQDKKEVIKITAEEITKELLKDDDATFKKYLGKTVEISGEVLDSFKHAKGPGWGLDLKGVDRGGGKGFSYIRMSFKPDTADFKKAQKLTKGKKVVVRGEFEFSFGSSILLKDVTIVSTP